MANNKFISVTAACCLLLAACDTFQNEEIISNTITTADFICDIREGLTPAQLSLKDVTDVVDRSCEQLRVLQSFGVLVRAPSAVQQSDCRLLDEYGLSETSGYGILCST